MKLAVAASVFLMATPWHSVAASQDPAPRMDAAVAKPSITNVRELGLRVSVAGHPHVAGTVTCRRGATLRYYGWDYDVSLDAIHRLAVRTGGPAKCSVTVVATVSGQPVPLSVVLYKR